MKNKRSLLSPKIRIVALILAVVMILTSIDLLAIFGDSLAFPTTAVAETLPEDAIIRNDALHFFIRHWNTAVDKNANLNDGTQEENGNFFVIVEGYIVPNTDEEEKASGTNYHFYLVRQSDGELIKLSEYAGDNGENSAYIKSVNRKTGDLGLNVNLLTDANGEELENFAGFSVSAGHGAVSYAADNAGITIKYDKNISLVKGHIFYTTQKEVKRGTTTEGEDNEYSILFGTENPEIDTMIVYTWTEHAQGQIAGAIVKDNQGNCIKAGDELPKGISANDVELTTFYSTTEGLHTNKTLMQSVNDDRMFLFNLDAWYTENYASQVGLMLDASGGMAFALDKPSEMTVYSAIATTLNLGDKGSDQIEAIYNDYNVSKDRSQLTNLANALTNAVGYDVSQEEVAQLFDMIDTANTTDLESRFLNNKLLGLLLNPRNTDNSAIGVNGYNYYVTANNVDYEPLGYWEGTKNTGEPLEEYEFKKSDDDVVIGWPDAHNDLSMSGDGLYLRASSNGIVLDAKPTTDNFTISFTLKPLNNTKNNYKDPANTAERKIKEILYIGSMSGVTSSTNPDFDGGKGGYYRLFRDEGSSSSRLRANSNTERIGDKLTDINNVFTNNTVGKSMVFTLVFSNGTVTSYQDGDIGVSSNSFTNKEVPFKFTNNDINIIINGIEDSYDGIEIAIDDIFVIDNALDAATVKSNYNNFSNQSDLIGWYTFTNSTPKPTGDGTSRWWMYNQATNSQNNNPQYDGEKFLGSFASKIEKKLHISSINGGSLVRTIKWSDGNMYLAYTSEDTLIGEVNANTMSQTGWYHVSHRGSKGRFEAAGTAKRLHYIDTATGQISIQDTLGVDGVDSNETYTTEENVATIFYIDSAGYLRCFYGNNYNAYCSYVYYLKDEQYTKAEGLQRILANFTTQLLDRSLGSEVSAVQFSYDGREDRSVMLDWTDDSVEISGIMSQTRGTLGTDDYGTGNAHTTSSRGVDQYNYALTGSTYFAAGLRAFQSQLMDYKKDDKGAKFFVIFTDGASNTDNDEKEAKEIVKKMKEADYTVISIFFGDQSKDENAHAIEFLKELAGGPSDTKNTIAAGEGYFYDANDMDTLMERFEKDILELMAKQLEGYTVKDYIDPRFNLVDQGSVAEGRIGTVWQLLANGRVELLGTSESYDLSKRDGIEFPVAGTSTPNVGNPMLRYDKYKDMYYLEWTDQIIPPGSIGAPKLQIWRAQVVLCAKDDFIGGNAILTNGNDAYMNWVYNPMDLSTESDEQAAYLGRRKTDLKNAYLDLVNNGKTPTYTKEEYIAKNLQDGFSEDELGQKYDELVEAGTPPTYTEEEYIAKNMKQYTDKASKHDASSGTSDVKMEYEEVTDENGNSIPDKYGNPKTYNKNKPLDAYVSKGFPRTTVNVGLTKIDVGSKYKVVYMGEVVSPSKLLTEIEGDTITDSYYLEYIKRYAYQRYLFSQLDEEILNKPIWDILNDWLQFGNAGVAEKSFSIPYMYLPSVEFDTVSGEIKMENGKATILNSTGFNTDAQGGAVFDNANGLLADVVGILTYRWEILEPTADKTLYGNQAATRDYVKNDTERIRYALTVGFTPLREGDILNGYHIDSNGEICTSEHDHGSEEYVPGLNDYDDDGEPIFAKYLPIRGVNSEDKWVWEDAQLGDTLINGKFIFDRATRVNNVYIKEKDENGDTVFAWNPEYKPAIYARQLQSDIMRYTNTDDTVNLINEGQEVTEKDENGSDVTVREFAGDPRTIKGYSVYSLNVVSGDVVLEFKLQTGELENLLKTQEETCDLDQEFKLDAKRSFMETEQHIQDLKRTLSDYGDTFTLTFKFDSMEIKAQLHKMYTADPEKYADYKNDYLEDYNNYRDKHTTDDEPDFEVTPLKEDAFGFVKIYAEATRVDYTWKTYNATTKDFDEQDSSKYEIEPLYEHLPIGAYEFSLADANKKNQDLLTSLRFGEIFSVGNDDEGQAEFKAAYEKFNDVVLNGLHTSNEKIVDKDGKMSYAPTPAQRRYDQGDKAGQLVYYTNSDTKPFTEDKAENYKEGTDSKGNKAWLDKASDAVVYWYDTNLKVWRYANGERVPYYWSESEIREITLDDVDADDNDEGMVIKSRSITHYIADSKAGEGEDEGKKVSFYLGTAQSYDEDGNLIYVKNPDDAEKYYPEHRVGIVGLNSGTTKLTIVEDGGKETESFKYRIKGTTLSGIEVDIIVTVKGGSHTTVDIVAGNYQVTEVSNWSWRYDVGIVTEAVEWKYLPDKDPVWNEIPGKGYGYEEGTAGFVTEWAWNKAGNVLEKTEAASEVSGWTKVTQTDEKISADITLYTDTYNAVITFTHGSNGKTWVGGENYGVTQFPKSSSERSQGTGT